ncbi:MAG: hemerythrin domain-containing protein, partial [Rhizobacter sp.]|nr:hemerythrin domain-containing protein [Rhizobacter sp.]
LAYAPETGRAGGRASIAARICEELTAHAQIEEEIFYPALRDAVPAAADVIEEAQQEHGQAKELIAQIRGAETADETLDDVVSRLARVIEHHVKEERDELFPKARSSPSLDLADLARQLRERRAN